MVNLPEITSIVWVVETDLRNNTAGCSQVDIELNCFFQKELGNSGF